MRRRGALFAAVGLALSSSTLSACMGSFLLTRKLYSFNDTLTGNKILNNLVFWALVFVIPIYGLALTIDGLILNVIEFWTGRNLLAEARVDDETGRVAWGTFEATPVGAARVEVRSSGALIAVVERTASGGIVVYDAVDVTARNGGMLVVTEDEQAAVHDAVQWS